jgi:hypothetical protein
LSKYTLKVKWPFVVTKTSKPQVSVTRDAHFQKRKRRAGRSDEDHPPVLPTPASWVKPGGPRSESSPLLLAKAAASISKDEHDQLISDKERHASQERPATAEGAHQRTA